MTNDLTHVLCGHQKKCTLPQRHPWNSTHETPPNVPHPPLRGRIWIGVIGWEPSDVHLGSRSRFLPLKNRWSIRLPPETNSSPPEVWRFLLETTICGGELLVLGSVSPQEESRIIFQLHWNFCRGSSSLEVFLRGSYCWWKKSCKPPAMYKTLWVLDIFPQVGYVSSLDIYIYLPYQLMQSFFHQQ